MQSVKTENDGETCQIFRDENGTWSWTNRTTGQINDVKNTDGEKEMSIACVIFKLAIPGMYMQVTACYLQLMIIVGLCLDAGKSLTCRFFKTKFMQFLGRISMSLYLIHEPLIYWLKFIIFGPLEWIDDKNPGNVVKILGEIIFFTKI